jgi:hypothetical protein
MFEFMPKYVFWSRSMSEHTQHGLSLNLTPQWSLFDRRLVAMEAAMQQLTLLHRVQPSEQAVGEM